MQACHLRIYHSHQPSATRRVAPVGLAASGPAGTERALFLASVCAVNFAGRLDDDDRCGLEAFLDELGRRARPPRGLRHRIQSDRHGLALSVHRVEPSLGGWRVTLDPHSPAAAQVVGALVALDGLGEPARLQGLQCVRSVIEDESGRSPRDLDHVHQAVAMHLRTGSVPLSDYGEQTMHAVDTPEAAWAIDTLGLEIVGWDDLDDGLIQRAYRKALRDVHPDHGAPHDEAALRLDEIRRARLILAGTAGIEADASAAGVRR